MKQQVYSDFAQTHIVQAQYFKDPHRLDEYTRKSGFLADINNEQMLTVPQERKSSYAENLSSLSNLVLFMFEGDTQVVPKESSVRNHLDC